MQEVADDTTRHCHRLAPQDRRPRRRPEGPRSGWPIPTDTFGPRRQSRQAPSGNATAHPPLPTFRTEKQLTAPADRSVHDPAHAVAFTAAVAIGGTGSSDRRATMASAVTRTGYRNRPGSPPATDSRHDPPPASPAIQARCFADHHPMVAHHPAWRWHAGPDVRRPVGAWPDGGRTRATRWARHNPPAPRPDPILVRKSGPAGDCACASLFMVCRITE